jgi:hypothetical protein
LFADEFAANRDRYLLFFTPADTTIHFTSNHSIEYDLAAYRFYIQRSDALPLSQEHKNKGINTPKQIALNIGYPYS